MLREMAKGSVWMIAMRLAERGLGVISMLLLARFLVPEDFGLIAMAMSVIVTLELFSVFSFDVALIQAESPHRSHYDTAFTLNVIFRTAIAVAMVLVAKPAAAFFGEVRLTGVMWGLSLGWLAQAFENIATVKFRREMQFGREFSFQTAKRLVSFFVTIALALLLKSYWALVAGMVVGRVTGLVMSYVLVPYRPRFTLESWRELMSFSVWLLINNVLYVINTRVSSFVIGRVSGSHGLGLFNMAREIGMLPTSELVVPIERALMAGYSRMAADKEKLKEGFLAVLSGVTLLTLPAAAGIAAVAEPLVIAVLSRKWIEAVPLLQVFGFLGAMSAMASNTYPAYIAIGRQRVTTCFAVARLVLLLPGMLILVPRMGPLGAAWAELCSALIMLPVGWFVLFKVLDIKVATFVGHMWRPLLGSLAMYFAVREYVASADAGLSAEASLLVLIVAVMFGALLYVSLVSVFWWMSGTPKGVEEQIMRRLQLRVRSAWSRWT